MSTGRGIALPLGRERDVKGSDDDRTISALLQTATKAPIIQQRMAPRGGHPVQKEAPSATAMDEESGEPPPQPAAIPVQALVEKPSVEVGGESCKPMGEPMDASAARSGVALDGPGKEHQANEIEARGRTRHRKDRLRTRWHSTSSEDSGAEEPGRKEGRKLAASEMQKRPAQLEKHTVTERNPDSGAEDVRWRRRSKERRRHTSRDHGGRSPSGRDGYHRRSSQKGRVSHSRDRHREARSSPSRDCHHDRDERRARQYPGMHSRDRQSSHSRRDSQDGRSFTAREGRSLVGEHQAHGLRMNQFAMRRRSSQSPHPFVPLHSRIRRDLSRHRSPHRQGRSPHPSRLQRASTASRSNSPAYDARGRSARRRSSPHNMRRTDLMVTHAGQGVGVEMLCEKKASSEHRSRSPKAVHLVKPQVIREVLANTLLGGEAGRAANMLTEPERGITPEGTVDGELPGAQSASPVRTNLPVQQGDADGNLAGSCGSSPDLKVLQKQSTDRSPVKLKVDDARIGEATLDSQGAGDSLHLRGSSFPTGDLLVGAATDSRGGTEQRAEKISPVRSPSPVPVPSPLLDAALRESPTPVRDLDPDTSKKIRHGRWRVHQAFQNMFKEHAGQTGSRLLEGDGSAEPDAAKMGGRLLEGDGSAKPDAAKVGSRLLEEDGSAKPDASEHHVHHARESTPRAPGPPATASFSADRPDAGQSGGGVSLQPCDQATTPPSSLGGLPADLLRDVQERLGKVSSTPGSGGPMQATAMPPGGSWPLAATYTGASNDKSPPDAVGREGFPQHSQDKRAAGAVEESGHRHIHPLGHKQGRSVPERQYTGASLLSPFFLTCSNKFFSKGK